MLSGPIQNNTLLPVAAVSNALTTEADVDRSVAAVLRAAGVARTVAWFDQRSTPPPGKGSP